MYILQKQLKNQLQLVRYKNEVFVLTSFCKALRYVKKTSFF